MKRALLAFVILITGLAVNAQDIKQAKKLLEKKDLAGARTQIDAFVAANPDKAEGLYLKGKIYEAIAADETMRNTVPDAAKIAFDALKLAIERKETSNELKLAEATDTKKFYDPLIALYSDYYKSGVAAFNAAVASQQQGDFEKAMSNFMSAENVGKYLTEIKIAQMPIVDTVIVLNIGQAAVNAGKEATALKYFKKLVDANIQGAGMELPYEWVAQYYLDKKDYDNFLKYQALGSKNLPGDNYFNLVLIDYYSGKKDYPNLFKGYEEIIAKNPDSSIYRLEYASEMFNFAYRQDGGKVEKKDEYLKTIFTQLTKILDKHPDDVKANWLMAQYYYNTGVENKTTSKENFTKSLTYLAKSIPQLESSSLKQDKSMYKSMVNLASTMYEQLHQPDKVKIYQQKYDDADKKFVNK